MDMIIISMIPTKLKENLCVRRGNAMKCAHCVRIKLCTARLRAKRNALHEIVF